MEREKRREERRDWIKLPSSTEPRKYEEDATISPDADDEQEAVAVPTRRGGARTRYGIGEKKYRDKATQTERPMEVSEELEATPNKWQRKSGGNGKSNGLQAQER
ncbi:MAG: hypothetical protein Q9183_005643 [Haloplaca sp. 2 TL-2023]